MGPMALPTETLPLASRLTLPPCPPSAPAKVPLLLAALPPRALIPPATRMSPLRVATTVGAPEMPGIAVVVRPVMKTSPADPPEPPWPEVAVIPLPPLVMIPPETDTVPVVALLRRSISTTTGTVSVSGRIITNGGNRYRPGSRAVAALDQYVSTAGSVHDCEGA